ncbi:MAG TPA: sterol desaturase family protein [Usitatibacteraceae bacterium]
MGLFNLEQSKAAYIADFVFYGFAVAATAVWLLAAGPRAQLPILAALTLMGLASWTLLEYVLHRFVLHGLQPFRRWHAEHHQRPMALICTPTILSATLIVTMVFLPALLLGDLWRAGAMTLGVMTGYLAYGITHHATHHWRTNSAWLKRRKLWHALHHRRPDQPGYYGVSNALWDHVFGSAAQPTVRRRN